MRMNSRGFPTALRFLCFALDALGRFEHVRGYCSESLPVQGVPIISVLFCAFLFYSVVRDRTVGTKSRGQRMGSNRRSTPSNRAVRRSSGSVEVSTYDDGPASSGEVTKQRQ